MKRLGGTLVAFGLLNGWLYFERSALESERAELSSRLEAISRQAGETRGEASKRNALNELARRAGTWTGDEPLSLARLRTRLIDAENGLSLDRLSLDFRPEQDAPPGFAGSQIQVSLRGRFSAVSSYLRRVEAMRLPVATEQMSLRKEAESGVALDISWLARWPLEGTEVQELSPSALAALDAWLVQREVGPPERNPFIVDRDPATLTPTPEPVSSAPEPVGDEPELDATPSRTRPELMGFVLARPELEQDVRRRVLAAIRYEGELTLVTVGDAVGGYVVQSIEARESVVLADAETGERLILTLE